MRCLSELTEEEAAAEADRLEERLREADREDAGLFMEQAFISTAAEDELRAVLLEDEVDEILAYRAAHSGEAPQE